MRVVISIFLFFCCFTGTAQKVIDLKIALKELAADKDLKNASISFYALDVDSNEIIASWDKEKSLVPASTMKLVTTATALEVFGENKRFSTSIQYSGKIDSNGTLKGNIYIKGGGDPSLGSKRFKKVNDVNFITQWTNAILKLGIDSITGQIIGDASIFENKMIPSTWAWSDIGNYYGAGACGLSIYENFYNLELTSGKSNDDPTFITKITPHVPNLELDNEVKSMNIKRDQSYIFGSPYQNQRIIRGRIPLNKKGFNVKGSIPDPAFLTAFELDKKLRGAGIKIANPATTLRIRKEIKKENRIMISTLYSPLLIKLIKKTNLHSINLYAEHFINHIGLNQFNVGDTESGAKAIVNFWKKNGVDVKGLYLYDGSGLSRFNSINSKQLVSVLNFMYNGNNKAAFIKTLPIAGKSGTLKSVGRETEISGKIKAKSGYMTRVRSYAGYATTKNNRNIAFALIVNNYNCSAYQMKKKMESIMIKLVEIDE